MTDTKFPPYDCGEAFRFAYGEEEVKEWFKRCLDEFPKCSEWDQFLEDMKGADVWYDVLDSHEEGKILDFLFEIIAWKKKYFGQFKEESQ